MDDDGGDIPQLSANRIRPKSNEDRAPKSQDLLKWVNSKNVKLTAIADEYPSHADAEVLIMKYITCWLPGGDLKRKAKEYATILHDLAEIPHNYVKSQSMSSRTNGSEQQYIKVDVTSLTTAASSNHSTIHWRRATLLDPVMAMNESLPCQLGLLRLLSCDDTPPAGHEESPGRAILSCQCKSAHLIRLAVGQQSAFCVNSLSWSSQWERDITITATDFLWITAMVTSGIKYDPIKWLLWTCEKLGSATHLKKGELTMELKRLRHKQEALCWSCAKSDLPVITWEDCKPLGLHSTFESRALICIAGFIHDISDFFDKHPGGPHLLKNIGKDATTAFFGGLYDHSHAANHLLARKRVGIVLGGAPHGSEEIFVPPSQASTRHSL
ncbi:hypothetical protein PAXINDRAFT_9147 [Paxillus involutus ATCC 200175]|nr:hypothetical protein PAXINDRAFT_9147 [Paxillus involutus ATCC 200175]